MKRVTVKEFFATFFGGIGQAIRWIVGMGGYKDETSFGKVVKRIFAICVTSLLVLFTGLIFYAFSTEVVYKKWIRPYTSHETWEEKHISNHIVFQQMYYSDVTRVYDENRKQVLLKNVDWVVTSDDKDSLAVFSRNGKRGYLNRFTGAVAIPETYSRAWVFSEGLAAVEKDGVLVFIDHSGKVVIDKGFQVHFNEPKYAFKKGYCILKDPVTGKMGLIDKKGNWALQPDFDNLFNDEGFWQVEQNGRHGLYTADMQLLFPIENTQITISDSVIEVRHADHIARRYDFEGNVLVDFVIDEVSNMLYETDQLKQTVAGEEDTEENNRMYAIANRQRYKVAADYFTDYYGLISREGKRITPPLYTRIEAIHKNRYLCQPQGIIIDDNGKVVEE